MPSSRHSSFTFVSGLPMAAMARRSFAAVILNFRPPVRPRARAAAKPARVRSAISSRSNSTRAGEDAEHQLARCRCGVDGGAGAGQHRQPDTAPRQIVDRVDQMAQVAAETVELPHHQRSPGGCCQLYGRLTHRGLEQPACSRVQAGRARPVTSRQVVKARARAARYSVAEIR